MDFPIRSFSLSVAKVWGDKRLHQQINEVRIKYTRSILFLKEKKKKTRDSNTSDKLYFFFTIRQLTIALHTVTFTKNS